MHHVRPQHYRSSDASEITGVSAAAHKLMRHRGVFPEQVVFDGEPSKHFRHHILDLSYAIIVSTCAVWQIDSTRAMAMSRALIRPMARRAIERVDAYFSPSEPLPHQVGYLVPHTSVFAPEARDFYYPLYEEAEGALSAALKPEGAIELGRYAIWTAVSGPLLPKITDDVEREVRGAIGTSAFVFDLELMVENLCQRAAAKRGLFEVNLSEEA